MKKSDFCYCVMATVSLLLLLLTLVAPARSSLVNLGLDLEPEVYMNATELITSKGYPCENHYVTTEDGYILNLLRIPHGVKHTYNNTSKPVVFLQHGLVSSASCWVINPANESLAFILADAGADVWLGNTRGNTYSRNHTVLKPDDERFWNFTFDDMAEFDLPTMLNYALAKSDASQLYYIGHSQGTTIAFAKFSEDKKLAAKVKHFVAMAPVARFAHTKSPYRILIHHSTEIRDNLDKKDHGAFEVSSYEDHILKAKKCQGKWRAELCENFSSLMYGLNGLRSLNMTRVPVYKAHGDSGTSTKNMVHFAQVYNAQTFQKYDYGVQGNLLQYNQPSPPIYDVSRMKLPPVAVFRGGHDWLSTTEDVTWLLPQINVTLDRYVDLYAHMDFILAMDAPTVIYQDVLRVIFGKAT